MSWGPGRAPHKGGQDRRGPGTTTSPCGIVQGGGMAVGRTPGSVLPMDPPLRGKKVNLGLDKHITFKPAGKKC